jgi:hypothetical protein
MTAQKSCLMSRITLSGQALFIRHGNRFDAAFQTAQWKLLRRVLMGKRGERKDVKLEVYVFEGLEGEVANFSSIHLT